jgi:hypothetical protein
MSVSQPDSDILIVEWLDAVHIASQISKDDDQIGELMRVVTVGFVVYENDDVIALASELIDNYIRNVTIIPKAIISKIKRA